jgi:hypothetical protein
VAVVVRVHVARGLSRWRDSAELIGRRTECARARPADGAVRFGESRTLVVHGHAEAGELLDTVLTGPVETRIRHQVIAETRGNPLALLEVPRGRTPAELAGGFGLPGSGPMWGSVEERFASRAGRWRSSGTC